LQIT
ncbi:hypothetical protein MTO96_037005, partial [Rhipicephalus appendiculatus]